MRIQMAPLKKHHPSTGICNVISFLLLLSAATGSAAVSTARCSTPSPTPELRPDGDDARQLLRSFQISEGYFSGGDGLFEDDASPFVPRSFSMFPVKVARTTDETFLQITAILKLYGYRSYYNHSAAGRRRSRHFVGRHSASFHVHGYYQLTSGELCMVGGSGSYAGDDGSVEHLREVNLSLRLPITPHISNPFITGLLDGADFKTISLAAYSERDNYLYEQDREKISCPPPAPTPEHAAAARGAIQPLDANFSCHRLRRLLVSSYKLEYASASNSSSPLLKKREDHMHVSQMHCRADGSARAYVIFSNNERTGMWNHGRFLVDEEAVVADGYWDSGTSRLCLRACRVEHPSSTDLKVGGCGIGMSFWFPAMWTIRDRAVVAGMLWNATQGGGAADGHAGAVISASSVGDGYRSTNLSNVKYSYTMVEKAKDKYLNTGLRSMSKKGRFPSTNNSTFSYQDFNFRFVMGRYGDGQASPVSIGPVMVGGDRLAAEYAYSRHAKNETRHAVAETKKGQLLDISYEISYFSPTEGWQPLENGSYAVPVLMEQWQISAEGVYDPDTGILCMIGCREVNGSKDCEILVTVHFASLDAKAQGHGRGRISSQREATDRRYFKPVNITLYGRYSDPVGGEISRMDMESAMVVASTTLSCVFTALQILHTKRRPEAAPATSVTMLVLLALGHITPLVLNLDALFVGRRKHYFAVLPGDDGAWLELNEVMLRVPALIAFVMQLRLLQLVWLGSRRRTDAGTGGSKGAAAPALAAADEKATLRVCLPMYLLGAAVAGVAHLASVRAAASSENPLVVRLAPEAPTLWEDLVSYAGLLLDGFLLPQVVRSAVSGSRVQAISPWFYLGCTAIRAAPHAYDAVVRARGGGGSVPSLRPSYVYANPREDLFGVAWDVAIPLGAALLALLLSLQQRLGGDFFLLGGRSRRRLGTGGYEMVSAAGSPHEVESAPDRGQEDAVAG